ESPYVSRAGLKLAHALDEFGLDGTGFVCADFGCNVGGFTDCLLQRGAARVYAIDTGYGVLDYRLRTDERVVVMERTNALHAEPPPPPGRGAGGEGAHSGHPSSDPLPGGEGSAGVDLVTIDLAWTPQRHAIPAALRWVKADGRIITLVKPHYELTDDEKRVLLVDGRLDPAEAQRVLRRVLESMPALGVEVLAQALSPITGRKSGRGAKSMPGTVGPGNVEYLVLARPAAGA
ncbi:MAG: SAM-dependent methyltransferase, partial [Planctomycetota bacterium]